MLFSHVKISPLLWLHNKSRLSQEKNCFNEMVWYFIGVYIINRTLHGRLRIRNFSSRVENISLVRGAYSWNIFQHLKRNFVSPRGHVISSISSHLKSWKDHCSNSCIISHTFCRKNIVNVKWFGMSLIGVYIINIMLHGHLEIPNFSSHVKSISLVHYTHLNETFFITWKKF